MRARTAQIVHARASIARTMRSAPLAAQPDGYEVDLLDGFVRWAEPVAPPAIDRKRAGVHVPGEGVEGSPTTVFLEVEHAALMLHDAETGLPIDGTIEASVTDDHARPADRRRERAQSTQDQGGLVGHRPQRLAEQHVHEDQVLLAADLVGQRDEPSSSSTVPHSPGTIGARRASSRTNSIRDGRAARPSGRRGR